MVTEVDRMLAPASMLLADFNVSFLPSISDFTCGFADDFLTFTVVHDFAALYIAHGLLIKYEELRRLPSS